MGETIFRIWWCRHMRLMSSKLFLVSPSSPYIAVDQHFFFRWFGQALGTIYFDEQWYLTKYPDIRSAVQGGKIAKAQHHYTRFGFYEHRLPYKIEIDEPWVLDNKSRV